MRYNVHQSTDGSITRIWFADSGSVRGYLAFERPANATSGWSNPSISVVAAGYAMTATALGAPTGDNARMRSGSTVGNVILTAEGTASNINANDSIFGNLANEIDGAWPMWPIGLASPTAGVRGRHGTLVDIWYGSHNVPSGDMYPTDGSNQFAQIGDLIIPWGGNAAPIFS